MVNGLIELGFCSFFRTRLQSELNVLCFLKRNVLHVMLRKQFEQAIVSKMHWEIGALWCLWCSTIELLISIPDASTKNSTKMLNLRLGMWILFVR